jgi:excisionase family DNA binding protein
MASPMPPFLTPAELAVRWCLSRRAAYERLATGHLPSTRLGGSIRIWWADVLAYEAASEQPAVIRPKALRQPRHHA